MLVIHGSVAFHSEAALPAPRRGCENSMVATVQVTVERIQRQSNT